MGPGTALDEGSDGRRPANARAETVATAAMFRNTMRLISLVNNLGKVLYFARPRSCLHV